jgi:hypothetical protein
MTPFQPGKSVAFVTFVQEVSPSKTTNMTKMTKIPLEGCLGGELSVSKTGASSWTKLALGRFLARMSWPAFMVLPPA